MTPSWLPSIDGKRMHRPVLRDAHWTAACSPTVELWSGPADGEDDPHCGRCEKMSVDEGISRGDTE